MQIPVKPAKHHCGYFFILQAFVNSPFPQTFHKRKPITSLNYDSFWMNFHYLLDISIKYDLIIFQLQHFLIRNP